MMASGLSSFVALFIELDRTTSTTAKEGALERYLASAPPTDAVWAIHFLTGHRFKRVVSSRLLRDWAAEFSGLPSWLVQASYDAVGDLAETLSLLCARGEGGALGSLSLAAFIEDELLALSREDEEAQRRRMWRWWTAFDASACFVVHKLVTGAFRVGVSATLVSRALAKVLGREPSEVVHRLMGTWTPDAAFAARLFAPGDSEGDRSRPYPFYLASPIEGAVKSLGAPDEWMAEWKWDGIRAQLIVRGGEVFLWSRGEELITPRFPELSLPARKLPEGTVLDGELVPWREGRVLSFNIMQTRIGRTNLTSRALNAAPVVLLAFDVLEVDGLDVRALSQGERRKTLERLLARFGDDGAIRLSPLIDFDSWEALGALRGESRSRGVEGVMLKRAGAPYRVGRPRGDWWKWKIEPHTIDAVMVYAQAGHGRRATLHTDYTFAVRDGDALVPIAKAYSGLTDEEISRLDTWIRSHTLQRFGPVRAVEPHHVFELGFEGIQPSSRHKGGIALRFPRILRWRTDKGVADASTLAELRAMIGAADTLLRGDEDSAAELSLFDSMPNAGDEHA